MDKKIALLTWLHNGNYGSVLQAYALQKFLFNNGYEAINLNYNASTKTKLINWIVNGNSPALFLGKLHSFLCKMKHYDEENLSQRIQRFELFKSENMKLTSLSTSPVEIKRVSKDYDIFICGSDQIWSPALMNPVFYFSYLDSGSKKIAYAPSFGVVQINKKKEKQIAKYLNSFNYISVRETQGQELIKKLTGIEAPVQVDPTMLLTFDDWKKLSGSRIKKESYVFCYLLTPNSRYIDAVKEFAKEKELSVVIVPTVKGPFNTGFEEFINAGPIEWLNLLINSDYVCTDSFHGCIFSCLSHKEFILFKRFSDDNTKSENSRIYTLTKFLGVTERIIDSNNVQAMNKLKSIDFQRTDDIISKASKVSADWLLNAIDDLGSEG